MPADRAILLGLDLGTTVLKAAAYARGTGEVLVGASERLKVDAGADGKREQDPRTVIGTMWRAFGDVRRALGRQWSRVVGIGLAAQGGSAVIVDPRSGTPRTPMFLWNDMRFMRHLPEVQKRKPLRYWRELAWRDEPGWGLAKLLWLRKTLPKAMRGGFLYAGAGDLLFHALTGSWRQDAGNAIQEGCYRVAGERLDGEPLRLVGAGLDCVSPLRTGHETRPLSASAARRLGLADALPVAGPYMDHEAGYMAAANLSRRPLQFSLGTAWVGNFIMPRGAKWASPFQLVVPSPTGEGKLVVQPLLTGNLTWDWCLRTLVDRNPKRAYLGAEAAFRQSLLPPAGLTALPWLNMPNPLVAGEIGGGAFFGISAHTGRTELLRALAAGMVHEARRVFAEVVAAGAVDSIILSGGASRSAALRTLFAAAFAPLPVRVIEDEEWIGTRGVLRPLGMQPLRTARRILAPALAIREQMGRGAAEYRELFDRLCGRVPSGGPVRILQTRAGSRA